MPIPVARKEPAYKDPAVLLSRALARGLDSYARFMEQPVCAADTGEFAAYHKAGKAAAAHIEHLHKLLCAMTPPDDAGSGPEKDIISDLEAAQEEVRQHYAGRKTDETRIKL